MGDSMTSTLRKLALVLGIPGAALGLAIAASSPAFAITEPTGNYSDTGSCPSGTGNAPCAAHFTAGHNPGNYNTRAYAVCEKTNGALFTVYGGWKAGTGQTSNTQACNGVASASWVVKSGFQFRQSNPIERQCYSFVAGDPRSGFC
jgi:hypothetical protein